MENQNVFEFAYFKLKEGASEADFLKVSETFKNEFLVKQEGLIDRKLVRSEDGTLCVVAIWNSKENAFAVAENMGQSAISQEYLSFMDAASVKIEHFTTIQD